MKTLTRSSVIALAVATVASLTTLTQTAQARPTVYDVTNNLNTTATPVTGAFSALASSDPTIGDSVTLASTGTLSSFACSIFNSATGNTGSITTGTVEIRFYQNNGSLPSASTLIGGFNGTFDFTSSPLSPGFYTFLQFSNLQTLGTPVVLNSNNIYVTQHFTNLAGGSTRYGVVYYDTSTFQAGSSANTFYQSTTTAAAGNYTLNGVANTQVAYQIQTVGVVVPETNTLAMLTMGITPVAGLVIARRRKKA